MVSIRIGSSYNKEFLDRHVNATAHPKYDCNYAFPGYDVAIVKLSTPITFSEVAQPICIADSFRENVGDVGYIVGYGASSVNRTVRWEHTWNFTYNNPDGELHENLVQFRTIERCGSLNFPVGSWLRHAERTICAVGNTRVTAEGDSGGPLMINRKGVWYQVGATSVGDLFDDDGELSWYSMYSRLSMACDWIEEETRGYVKCVADDD